VSIQNFIPAVWAGSILRALDTLLVYASATVINTDYEGDIANAGDSVKITMLGDVDVKTYTRNIDIDAPQELTDAQLTLLIDQLKYFNFQVDDVDKRQAKGELRREAARRAAYGLRKVMDSFVAAMHVEIDVANRIGTDGVPITGFVADPKVAYKQLVNLRTKLDNTDTPEDDRWVVVPPWYEGYLLQDDRFVSYGTGPNREELENGRIGRAAGFEILKSNQVPNTAGNLWKVIAGHRSAWSRAQQILETEAYRPERRFGDALKGLHVYGAKTVRPSNLAVLTANDA
jgi:hypothetical protein